MARHHTEHRCERVVFSRSVAGPVGAPTGTGTPARIQIDYQYEFGFFGDTRVHGYQSDKVKAERAYLAHATYGFELSELLRVDGIIDLAWATDEAAGLDNELLAGVGVAGTFVGPWQTLVNVDLGVAVEGPDDGVTAWVVFLKLLDWQWLEGWLE